MDDPETYCRDVEAYLCRKNDGHLVRIVGPAFEQVCGWAARGIPLKVVYRGVDRYVERYYAKGPRRRPVRVEFCEADVLDVFDEWRKSVGVGDLEPEPAPAGDAREGRPRASLAAHLEKLVALLTTRRGGADRTLDEVLDRLVRELDTLRAGSKGVRGERRNTVLQRLRELDAELLERARSACDSGTLQDLSSEADVQLAPFRGRMTPDAYAKARSACVERLIRERLQLPVIVFD
jgi:hypothetical protein